jgi:peptidoglycan hydrolase-like protein with peptidoglycan-binding domain
MKTRPTLIIAVLMLVIPAALLVWVRIWTEDRLDVLHVERVPIEAPVHTRADTERQVVEVSLLWAEPPALVAPMWSGLVTAVLVSPGDTLVDGDRVAAVDGVARVVVVSSMPFHRALRPKDQGQDVAMLQDALFRFGYLDDPADGVFGSSTLSAVGSWAKDLGVTTEVSEFDPGWVIWLPRSEFVVGGVNLEPGHPVPELGEPVVSGPPLLDGVTLGATDGFPIVLDGAWQLGIGDLTVELEDGHVGVGGLQTISAILEPEVHELQGVVELANPRAVVDVPAAAIITGASGNLCVYKERPSGWMPVVVDVTSGRPGYAQVASGLSEGDVVLANPSDVLEMPACP